MVKSCEDYEAKIKELHTLPISYPDNKSLQSKLKYQLGKWADLLEVIVFAASNEQKGWTMDELSLPVKPMHTKEKSNYDQVGDYQFFIGGHINEWGKLLIERKEVSDLYGTLMKKDSRERFYREIDRYKNDSRFNQMIIMVEGSMKDFMTYSPKFNGRSYNKNHSGASVASKRGSIAALFARGVPVLWCGSRGEAVRLYPQLIRQWIIKNYTALIRYK